MSMLTLRNANFTKILFYDACLPKCPPGYEFENSAHWQKLPLTDFEKTRHSASSDATLARRLLNAVAGSTQKILSYVGDFGYGSRM